MKKLLSLILSIVMAISCFAVGTTAFAACSHKNSLSPLVLCKATNNNDGLVTFKCSKCGKRIDVLQEKIPRITEYEMKNLSFHPESIKFPKAYNFDTCKIAGLKLSSKELINKNKLISSRDFSYQNKVNKSPGLHYRTVKLSNKYYNQTFNVAYSVSPRRPLIKKATIEQKKLTIKYKLNKNKNADIDRVYVYLYGENSSYRIANATLNKSKKTVSATIPSSIPTNGIKKVKISFAKDIKLSSKVSLFSLESKQSNEKVPKIVIRIK